MPPESVVDRLRAWGVLPLIYVAVVSVAAVAFVYVADISRVWLVALVLLAGAAGLFFFSSRTGWNFRH